MQCHQQSLGVRDYAVYGWLCIQPYITNEKAQVELDVQSLALSVGNLRRAGVQIYQKTFRPEGFNPVTVYSLCDLTQPNDACIKLTDELNRLFLGKGSSHE